jgi:hypothetical protein
MLFRVSRQVLRVVVAGMLVAGSTGLRADNIPPTLPDFMQVSWLAAAVPTLAKAAVATNGIAVAPSGTGIQKSDTVTLLVQAVDDKTLRQWAVVLSINDLKPEEKKWRSPAFSMYLNTGRKVDFSPGPFEGVLIHVFGPFSEKDSSAQAKDIWAGSLVDPQFLGLGLDQTAAMFRRLFQKSAEEPPGKVTNFGCNTRPFPPDQIPPIRAWADRLAVTENEERSFGGFVPVLLNFFQIASQTPGVRDIVFTAIDIPWWSIAAHGGRITDTNFDLLGPCDELSAADWDLPPEMHVYSIGLRLSLQGKPALHCRLALTTPRVPLLNCAGIIGLAAMRPDGKGPHLMVRVMAAKPAATAPAH